MGEKKYILSLDEGTTSCRAVLFSLFDMRATVSYSEPIESEYPFGGWVEQNANDIFQKQMLCVRRVFDNAAFDAGEVAAIGITNQRESVVIWDKKTGKALAPCISWQCRRTAGFCEELKNSGWSDKIKRKTGLVIDSYFSATKLKWLLDHTPHARRKAEKGELLAGTLDSFLIYRLTNGARHITDVTNASRTMLFNINEMRWDDELLALFDIPRNILPTVVECAGDFGEADVGGTKIEICGIAGDQQASLIGQTCFSEGDVKCTYGTGAFLLANIGKSPRIPASPLLTTVAYKINGSAAYAFEGSVFHCGSVVNWLRGIGLIASASESEAVARGVPDSGGVYLVPAFTGMGAPYWDMNCRAAIVGITRATTRNHIVRAGLEGIALRCAEVYNLMAAESGSPLGALYADGGASQNSLLLEMQADILGTPVYKSREKECTALGAAYLAGIGCGIFDGIDSVRRLADAEKIFKPEGSPQSVDTLVNGWQKAVASVLGK